MKRWLRRWLPWGKKDDCAMDDKAFEQLFEQMQGGVEGDAGAAQEAAENSRIGQMSFEDAYVALLDTEKNLKTTFKMIEEANQEMRKIIGDFEKQANK
jgi:hypothetical protein